MVDDGIQQGLLVLGERPGECAGCGLGGFGNWEGAHLGFLAEFLKVQSCQEFVGRVAVACQIPPEALPHGKVDIGCQFLPSGLQIGFCARHFLEQRLDIVFISGYFSAT